MNWKEISLTYYSNHPLLSDQNTPGSMGWNRDLVAIANASCHLLINGHHLPYQLQLGPGETFEADDSNWSLNDKIIQKWSSKKVSPSSDYLISNVSKSGRTSRTRSSIKHRWGIGRIMKWVVCNGLNVFSTHRRFTKVPFFVYGSCVLLTMKWARFTLDDRAIAAIILEWEPTILVT